MFTTFIHTIKIIFLGWVFLCIANHPIISHVFEISFLENVHKILQARTPEDALSMFLVLIGVYGLLLSPVFLFIRITLSGDRYSRCIAVLIALFSLSTWIFPGLIYKDIGTVYPVEQDISNAYRLADISISPSLLIYKNEYVVLKRYKANTYEGDGGLFKPLFCTKDNRCFTPYGSYQYEYFKTSTDPRRLYIRVF